MRSRNGRGAHPCASRPEFAHNGGEQIVLWKQKPRDGRSVSAAIRVMCPQLILFGRGQECTSAHCLPCFAVHRAARRGGTGVPVGPRAVCHQAAQKQRWTAGRHRTATRPDAAAAAWRRWRARWRSRWCLKRFMKAMALYCDLRAEAFLASAYTNTSLGPAADPYSTQLRRLW